MRQQSIRPIVLASLGAAFFLGLAGSRMVLGPLERVGQFVRNPFSFATRVTPSGPVVLQQVQQLNRLETCRYNGQAVVRGDTTGVLPAWIAGDRILFIGQGEVVAGIDLARLQSQDVQVQESGVTLHLPAAEILHTRLDNLQSEVYERQTGLFSKPDGQLETKVRVEAEERIRQAALNSGVLKTAEANAREVLRRHLKMFGYQEINFI